MVNSSETNVFTYYDPRSENFDKNLTENYVDLVSEKLGGSIVSCSDEFFAAAENLLKSAKPIFVAGKFTG